MKNLKLFAPALFLAAMVGSAQADGHDPVENLMEGCGAEIENFCSQVTLGEGRLMACFFAHEDKLSNRCIHSLYDAAVALDRAINALAYVAAECGSDIDKFCGDVVPGEGAILNCLSASRDSIGEQCSTALSDIEK